MTKGAGWQEGPWFDIHYHNKLQGLSHLALSVSRFTAALANISSVSLLFSFLVDCNGIIIRDSVVWHSLQGLILRMERKFILLQNFQFACGIQPATNSEIIVEFLSGDKTVGGMKLRGYFRIATSFITGVAITWNAHVRSWRTKDNFTSFNERHLESNIGTKCNSLTLQFIAISTTIDTWAKYFDSIESSSGPQRLQIQFLQGGQVHCGIPNAYIIAS